jgi:hypothetical protein
MHASRQDRILWDETRPDHGVRLPSDSWLYRRAPYQRALGFLNR